MNLFEDIEKEHLLLEKATGSLVAMTDEMTRNESDELKKNIESLCYFFINFMVNYHTQKEENVIFAALEKLNLPRDKGPLFYYALEHADHLKHLDEMLLRLGKPALTGEDKNFLYEKSKKFCIEVWEHIDKENSVFLVEVGERVRGGALLEMNAAYESFLAGFNFPGLSAEENIALAESMIARYKPVLTLPEHIRGDGCMSCRFFGEGCNGIEHEWWTEHEWEDFFERNNRD